MIDIKDVVKEKKKCKETEVLSARIGKSYYDFIRDNNINSRKLIEKTIDEIKRTSF